MEAPSIDLNKILISIVFMLALIAGSLFYLGMKVQEHYYPPCEEQVQDEEIGYAVIDSNTVLMGGDTVKKDWRPKYKKP